MERQATSCPNETLTSTENPSDQAGFLKNPGTQMASSQRHAESSLKQKNETTAQDLKNATSCPKQPVMDLKVYSAVTKVMDNQGPEPLLPANDFQTVFIKSISELQKGMNTFKNYGSYIGSRKRQYSKYKDLGDYDDDDDSQTTVAKVVSDFPERNEPKEDINKTTIVTGEDKDSNTMVENDSAKEHEVLADETTINNQLATIEKVSEKVAKVREQESVEAPPHESKEAKLDYKVGTEPENQYGQDETADSGDICLMELDEHPYETNALEEKELSAKNNSRDEGHNPEEIHTREISEAEIVYIDVRPQTLTEEADPDFIKISTNSHAKSGDTFQSINKDISPHPMRFADIPDEGKITGSSVTAESFEHEEDGANIGIPREAHKVSGIIQENNNGTHSALNAKIDKGKEYQPEPTKTRETSGGPEVAEESDGARDVQQAKDTEVQTALTVSNPALSTSSIDIQTDPSQNAATNGANNKQGESNIVMRVTNSGKDENIDNGEVTVTKISDPDVTVKKITEAETSSVPFKEDDIVAWQAVENSEKWGSTSRNATKHTYLEQYKDAVYRKDLTGILTSSKRVQQEVEHIIQAKLPRMDETSSYAPETQAYVTQQNQLSQKLTQRHMHQLQMQKSQQQVKQLQLQQQQQIQKQIQQEQQIQQQLQREKQLKQQQKVRQDITIVGETQKYQQIAQFTKPQTVPSSTTDVHILQEPQTFTNQSQELSQMNRAYQGPYASNATPSAFQRQCTPNESLPQTMSQMQRYYKTARNGTYESIISEKLS